MQKLKSLLDKHQFISKYWWGAIIVLTLPAVLSLLIPGFIGVSDDLHIAWLYEMDRALRSGQIPPRFVPDLSYGFGYPLFNFVFPFPFYIGELFHLFGMNFVDSIKAVFIISVPLSAIFMYLLLKEYTTRWLSLAGAVLYVYTPYRAVDLYVRGAIGEIVSFALLPVSALAITKLTGAEVERKRLEKRWIGIGALSVAALILSHNITSYMFFPFLGLLGLARILFVSKDKILSLVQFALALVLGLLASVYFWLPALLESSLMKYDTVFNFIDHFPTIRQLVTPFWGYGASLPGPGDGISFYLGLINILLILAALVLSAIYWKKINPDQKVLLVISAIFLFFALLMMNYRSTILWQNLPLLPYFQFPWRFLMLTTFLTPVLVIVLPKLKIGQLWVSLSVIIISIVMTAGYFKPSENLGRFDDYYLNRYIPVPVASAEYRKLEEEYLRLPKSTFTRPDRNYPRVTIEGGQLQQVEDINNLDSKFEVDSDRGATVIYNKYYFPGWEALVDGKPVNITPGKPFGQITFPVPPGEHAVEVAFKETYFRKILDIISLISIVAAILLLIKPVKLRYKFI